MRDLDYSCYAGASVFLSTPADLAKVPDADFQALPEGSLDAVKMTEQTANQLARISHLNAKKTDGFMIALLDNRPDLAGLPFAMGERLNCVRLTLPTT